MCVSECVCVCVCVSVCVCGLPSGGPKGAPGDIGAVFQVQLGRGGRCSERDGCRECRMPRRWLELGSRVSESWGGGLCAEGLRAGEGFRHGPVSILCCSQC